LRQFFLILGLLLLYFKPIIHSDNHSGEQVLGLGPFICLVLTLILIVTALILFGTYLRRDTYEDYSFPLKSVTNDTNRLQSFDLHSLRNYAKRFEDSFSHDRYLAAERELREDANSHYHTVIGWSTGFEIIAAILVFLATVVEFWYIVTSRAENA